MCHIYDSVAWKSQSFCYFLPHSKKAYCMSVSVPLCEKWEKSTGISLSKRQLYCSFCFHKQCLTILKKALSLTAFSNVELIFYIGVHSFLSFGSQGSSREEQIALSQVQFPRGEQAPSLPNPGGSKAIQKHPLMLSFSDYLNFINSRKAYQNKKVQTNEEMSKLSSSESSGEKAPFYLKPWRRVTENHWRWCL